VDYGADDASFQMLYSPADDDPEGGAIMGSGEIKQTLSVHIWTDEDAIRENALMMVEDALDPVEWMTGFMLEMPHYYNLRAVYSVERMTYEDSPDDNARRYRKLLFSIVSHSPKARRFVLPRLDPRAVVEVSD